jgi:hypothetical protein
MGTPECDHLTLRENHIVACGWISSSPFLFGLYTKLAESADQNVLSFF